MEVLCLWLVTSLKWHCLQIERSYVTYYYGVISISKLLVLITMQILPKFIKCYKFNYDVIYVARENNI